jgi:hypothetical protein
MAVGRDAPHKAAARGVASVGVSVETFSSGLPVLLQNSRVKNGRLEGALFRATACRLRKTRLIALRGTTAASPRDAQRWARQPARCGRAQWDWRVGRLDQVGCKISVMNSVHEFSLQTRCEGAICSPK